MRFPVAMLIALMPWCASAGERAAADAGAVAIYRAGMASAVQNVRDIAGRAPGDILSSDDKAALRGAWSAFLDYQLALDSVGGWYRKQRSEPAMVITYAAFLAQYRGALELIAAANGVPGADAVLNEAVPGIGVPEGSFARLKFRYLNVARATEYAALESLYRLRSGNSFEGLRRDIEEDSRYILAAGRRRGPMQTAANALKIATSAAFTAWFPVQKGVAEWMGDTRVARGHTFLVTQKQIAGLAPRLDPGDVLLERREWYVSNVGLPGFWPHAAMYIGDAATRRRYFDDADVRDWVREQGRPDGDFEAFLRDRNPTAYGQSAAGRVIEAVSEGVSFTTLEYSAAADTLAVLRPRVSKRDKAIAIARAFGYVGRPYDFNFDFHTDASLVCTEVIYKAFGGSLKLPLSTALNRPVMPANEIVRELDRTWGTPEQQFDLIAFFDGHEQKKVAIEAGASEFRESWRRPKWHILRQ
ncbi:MAG TPA: YiiX/YebB-like N1pC/P60 family cysteine hydrolase [Thermoanaerobaculia bacterium]|nr:YiiX/YebB-like N1pC/P60 family cysteine hydrolase [Thermoanaerobaculia bacterium]